MLVVSGCRGLSFHYIPVQSLIKVSQRRHCLLLQPMEMSAPEINGKFFLKKLFMRNVPPSSHFRMSKMDVFFGGWERGEWEEFT